MARKVLSTEARLIPNFALDKPWNAPTTQEEQEQIGSSTLLSGIAPTDRAVSALLAQFAGDYEAALANASSQTRCPMIVPRPIIRGCSCQVVKGTHSHAVPLQQWWPQRIERLEEGLAEFIDAMDLMYILIPEDSRPEFAEALTRAKTAIWEPT